MLQREVVKELGVKDKELQFPIRMFYVNTMAGFQGTMVIEKLFLAFGDLMDVSVLKQI